MGAAADLVTGPTEEHQHQPDDDDDDAYGPKDRDGEYGTKKEEDEPKNDHAGLFPLTTEIKPVVSVVTSSTVDFSQGGQHLGHFGTSTRQQHVGIAFAGAHEHRATRPTTYRTLRTIRHITDELTLHGGSPGRGSNPRSLGGRGVEVLGTLELRSFEVLRGPSSLGHRPPQSAGTSHVCAGPVLNPCTDQTGGTGWTTGVAPSGVNAPRRR